MHSLFDSGLNELVVISMFTSGMNEHVVGLSMFGFCSSEHVLCPQYVWLWSE